MQTGTVGKEERSEDWLEYFDVVVTGCMKPAFFEVKKPLFEVDTATGALFNTDNGTPMIPIGKKPPPSLPPSPPPFSQPQSPHASKQTRSFVARLWLLSSTISLIIYRTILRCSIKNSAYICPKFGSQA